MALRRGRGAVWVDPDKEVITLCDLVEALFPSNEKRRQDALKLLQLLKREGTLLAEKWKDYVEELGISRGDFYKTLFFLRRVGMIQRRKRKDGKVGWRLSVKFSVALRRLAEFWEDFVADEWE